VPGASAAPAASAPAKGGMLLFGKAQEAVGLDPHLTPAISGRVLTALVYERLVYLNDKGEPTGELAEKWSQPDPTTYTFSIRKGVKFHNGRELKAADVKYSFERILDKATASPWATQLAPVQSIETSDDYTVTFKLKTSFGPFLNVLAFDWAAIVPQEAVKQYGDLTQRMVGTGPFVLDEYVLNTRTVLKAFPQYWGTRPAVDGITFRIIPDEAARLASLRTGEVQMAQLSDPLAVGMASRTEGARVISQPTTDYYMFAFNVRKKPFDDIRVRQAVALAINRKAVMDTVVFGDAELVGVLPPTLGDWATPISQLPYAKQDLAKAKTLLADAGYPNGFAFTVLASPQYSQFPAIGLAMQSQLKQIGVTLNVDPTEWGSFLSRWRARDFDSFISYQAAGSDPDDALYQNFRGGSSFNAVGLDDPKFNELLDKGRSTTDRSQRLAIYKDAQLRADEVLPDIFLFTRTEYMGVRSNVQGFKLSPVATFTYRALRTVWLQP
jgi:peptide/nickel transport system substrate-binding protein